MGFETNGKQYEERIKTAVLAAVMDASRDPATNIPVVLNGETAKALLSVIALFAASSSVTSSPTKTREFTDTVAKNLRVQITALQKQ